MIPVVLMVVLLVLVFSRSVQAATVESEGSEVKGIGYVAGKPVTLDLQPVGDGLYLRHDAAVAFLAMRASAQADGVSIPVTSAFRTEDQQAALLSSLGAYGVNGGVAAPVGKSPHQGGYAIDVAGLNPSAANYDAMRDAWLTAHCAEYGWHRTGLTYVTQVEPWHMEFHT